jgi:hypothetical protein
MAVVTADQVVLYTDISATAGTITSSGLIPVVQERIGILCNQRFTTDINQISTFTFNAASRTITSNNDWESDGFADGDEVYVHNSYRNDGYYDVLSVSSTIMTLASGESVIDELSGRSILVSMVQWPVDVTFIAAQMVKYDYDDRAEQSEGVTSRRLGPWSETYGAMTFGYPAPILEQLSAYRIVSMI